MKCSLTRAGYLKLISEHRWLCIPLNEYQQKLVIEFMGGSQAVRPPAVNRDSGGSTPPRSAKPGKIPLTPIIARREKMAMVSESELKALMHEKFNEYSVLEKQIEARAAGSMKKVAGLSVDVAFLRGVVAALKYAVDNGARP
jgi:hypothetical protein